MRTLKLDKKLRPVNKRKRLVLIGVALFVLLIAFTYAVYSYAYSMGVSNCMTGESVCRRILSPIGYIKEDKRTLAQKIEDKIRELWGDQAVLAKAVFMAESHLSPRAEGHNCFINGVSTWCKDESLAWSSDCGVAQINFLGKTCPEIAFDWEWNLNKAHEMYLRRGFQPWTAYNKKWFLAYLDK